ncbi:acyl-CoA-binding domain-containing protein 4-like protein [Tanacetum coccineum]
MPLISSLPPFMVGGVDGRLVMLVSLGGRLFELMPIGLSRFRYLLAVFALDKLQVKQHHSTSVPSHNVNVHTSEAPPENGHQHVSQPTDVVGVNKYAISDGEVHGDAIHAANADTYDSVSGTKLRYEHATTVVDDKMYLFGGNHNGRQLNDIQRAGYGNAHPGVMPTWLLRWWRYHTAIQRWATPLVPALPH